MIQSFVSGLWRASVYFFLRRRRFTNNLVARIRHVILVLSVHFPGAADANDEETQKEGLAKACHYDRFRTLLLKQAVRSLGARITKH